MEDQIKILAVDDNAANLTTIEQELQDYYEVVTMLTGRRALKYLYQEKVDLILLDVQMPIMDSIETLREIRKLENGATIPVIFLTAMKDKSTVIEGARLGILDYITKPFDADNLRERIRTAFIRLGRFEAPPEMVLKAVNDTLESLREGKLKTVAAKLEEMQSYDTEEELHERIRHAKMKYSEGESDTAENMLIRLKMVLEKELGQEMINEQLPISAADIRTRLLFILSDLENFFVRNAGDKLDDLCNYAVPDHVREELTQAKNYLNEYDDGNAEKVIRGVLVSLKDMS